jgi:hypothetical protein
MCHCGARFKFLALSFKQRLVPWDSLLILNPQRHIHKRCSSCTGQGFDVKENSIITGTLIYFGD